MKRTRQQMVADVMRETRGQATLLEAGQALQDAFNFVDSRGNWEFLEKKALINYEGPYSTGTVTIATGSVGVTGTGTAWDWTSSTKYWSIKLADRQLEYDVAAIGGPTSLTLATALSGSAGITDGDYRLIRQRYTLPSDCEPGRDRKLKGPLGWGPQGDGNLHKLEVGRIEDRKRDALSTGGNPIYWTDDAFDDTLNCATIRLWPAPRSSGEMRLTYYRKLPFPATSSALSVFPEAFELLPVNLAAARIMRRKNQLGWKELAADASAMLGSLYSRHAASSAYEQELEPDTGEDYSELEFGFDSTLFVTG